MEDPTLNNQGPDLQRMALTAAFVAALTLVACGDRDREVGGSPQATPGSTTTSATARSAPSASAPAPNRAPSIPAPSVPAMAAADRDFVSLAASGDTFEIEMSRLALDKTQADVVKTFAQHMIDDHTKISEQLRSIARSAGITDMLSMNATHSADLERLRALSGRDFDREYAAQVGVAAHQEAVALFTQTSRMAADAQQSGTLLHIATHDIPLADRLLAYIRQHNVPKSAYEFAMLYGIQRQQQLRLVNEGQRLSLVSPALWLLFGKKSR
jgi:putative membrane protein